MLLKRRSCILIVGITLFAWTQPLALKAAEWPATPNTAALAKKLRIEKKREKRVKEFLSFATSTLEAVKALPEGIDDSEIERAEAFFDYEIFLNGVDAFALTKEKCPRTIQSLEGLADPSGKGDAVNEIGKTIVELVRSVCRT